MMQRAILDRFEIRREAPIRTFYRFGPSRPADYFDLSISDRETPRLTRYAILRVGNEEVDLLAELLPPGAEVDGMLWFEDRRSAKWAHTNGDPSK